MSSDTESPKKSALVKRDVVEKIRAQLRKMAVETPPRTDCGMSRRQVVQDELMADLKACLKAGWTEAQLVEAMAGVGLEMSPKTLETYVRLKPGKARKARAPLASTERPKTPRSTKSSMPVASTPVQTNKDEL